MEISTAETICFMVYHLIHTLRNKFFNLCINKPYNNLFKINDINKSYCYLNKIYYIIIKRKGMCPKFIPPFKFVGL